MKLADRRGEYESLGAGGIAGDHRGGDGLSCARHQPARRGRARPAQSSKPFSPQQVRFFEDRVRPILKARCLKCHGEGPKVKGGFRLDSREAVLRGGELGPAVSLSEPEASRLLQAIRYEELEMPPSGKLPAGEIDILTRWVKEGVPWTARSR